MGNNQETTTKFKVDISELKAGMQEAQRQIRLANAEFKAATAGMDNWGQSADGVTAKITQLTSVQKEQEKQLDALKQQYAIVAKEQGESSKGAQELAIKIANQEAALGKTEKELRNYNIQLDTLTSDTKKAADEQLSAVSAMDKLKNTIAEQEKELNTLKSAYSNVALEQGKGSDEARELASQISTLSGELNQNKSKLNDAEDAADDLTDAFDDTDESARTLEGGFTVIKGAIASLLADGIKALVGGLKDLALESQKANNTFQTATGASTAEMEEFSDAIERVYSKNFGESLEDVAESMAQVKQQTREIDPSKLEELTENAITLRDTFGFEVNETMRAAKMLMDQFGVSGEEAFNLIVQGAQNGLDKNGDLLDSINEYSVHYKQIGYDAEVFFNSLVNGAAAGTFSVDKLGDTMKEFGIRTKDNSDSTKKAFRDLGYSANALSAIFAEGGEKASAATTAVMDDLLSMQDKVKQNEIGVALFGTMWEDLGIEGVKALMNVNGEVDKTTASMEEIKAIKYDDIGSAFTEIGRTLRIELLQPIIEEVTPALHKFAEYLKENLPPIIENLKTWAPVLVGIGTAIATAFIAGKVIAFAGAVQKAITIFKSAQTITLGFNGAMKALNLTLTLNPIGLVVTAIAGLVAALVVAYKKVDWFREGVDKSFSFVNTVVRDVVKSISGFLTKTLPDALFHPIKFIKNNWVNIGLLLVNPFAAGFKLIYEHSETFRNFINDLFQNIVGLIDKIFPGAVAKVRDNLTNIITLFKNGEWGELGSYLVQGIARGIINASLLPVRAVTTLAKAIVNKFKSIFKIASPSKVMEEQGKYIDAGVESGIKKGQSKVVDATKDLAKSIEDNLTINKSKYEKLLDGIVTALKKSLEKEKSARLESIESQLKDEEKASEKRLKILEEEYDNKISLFDAETNEQIKAVQDKIDAIDAEEAARERAAEEAEHNATLQALMEKLLSAESAEDKAEIQKSIDEEIAEWNEKKRKEEIEAQKEALQEQIDAIKEASEKKKEELEKSYDDEVESEKERLESIKSGNEEEKSYWEEYYADRLSDENINAEARKLVIEGNQNEILDLLETYNPKWQDAGQSLADSLINGLNSEKQNMADAIGESINLGDTIKNQESQLEALKAISDSKGGGGGKDDGGLDDLGKTLDDLEFPTDDALAFDEAIQDINDDSDLTSGVMEETENSLSSGWQNVKTSFSNGWNEFKSNFSSGWEEFKTSFAEGWNNVKTEFLDGFESLKNGFLEWWSAFKQIFVDGWNSISDFFTETIPAWIKSVGDWFNRLPGVIYDMVVNILGHLLAWGIMLTNFLTNDVANFINGVVDWFASLPGKIWKWISQAYDKVSEWGKNLHTFATTKIPEFVNNIVTYISQLPGKFWTWLVETYNKVVQWGSDIIATGKKKVDEFLTTVIAIIKTLPGEIWKWFLDTIQKAVDFGVDLAAKGKQAGEDLVHDLVEAVAGLPDKLYDLGANALEGFWNGLKSVGSRIKEWATKFFNDILDKAEEVLDIASPSKEFKRIGKYVMEGFSIGMGDEAKETLKQTATIFGDIVNVGKDAARNRLSGMSTSNQGGAYAAEPVKSTQVTNNFYQTNNSPRALSRREIYRQTKNILNFKGV